MANIWEEEQIYSLRPLRTTSANNLVQNSSRWTEIVRSAASWASSFVHCGQNLKTLPASLSHGRYDQVEQCCPWVMMTLHLGLVTFLTVAVKLIFPFLPIMWQTERPYLGQGHFGQISQSYITLNTSLVSKRVALDHRNKPEIVYMELIEELTVLHFFFKCVQCILAWITDMSRIYIGHWLVCLSYLWET